MKKIIFAIALLISTFSFAAKLAEVSGAYFYDESIMNGTLTISSEFSELLFESMEVEAKQIVNEHNEVTAIIK